MAPLPCASMRRPSAWHDRNSPVRLTSITFCHWARDISSAGAALAMPALFTARRQRAERFFGAFDGGGQILLVDDVAGRNHGLRPSFSILRRLLDPRAARQVEERDIGTGAREAHGNALADAAAGTGYECDFA